MRLLATTLPLLLVAMAALAPSAAAAANGCAIYNPAPPVPHAVPVFGPYPNFLGPATCTVVPLLGDPGPAPTGTGLQFTSTTPACPALPFIGAMPGEYCGKLVPAFTKVICTAQYGGALTFGDPLYGLVIGLDYVVPLTADGNVVETVPLDHEPLRYDNVPETGVVPKLFSVEIENPLPLDARVIAYPILNQPQAPGPVLVDCF
jgi:hypothetical protein